MTPDEIAADRAVIDAATDGDWQVLVGASWAGEVVVATSDGHPIAVVSTAPADPGAIADATAIAAARTGWSRALDALEAAQAGNDRLGALVEWQAEVIVDARDACQRAESIEPSGSPEWVESGIAMRTTALREVRAILDRERNAHPSALDKVTAERDEARAEVDRLREDAATFERMFREALDGKWGAEATIAEIREICESNWLNIEVPDLWGGRSLVVLVDDIMAVLNGDES